MEELNNSTDSTRGGNPVGNIMENLAVNARDFIDNTFQGDLRSKDEIREDRELAANQFDARMNEAEETFDNATGLTQVGTEAVRSVVGGVAASVENVGEAVEFAGDAVKSVTGLASETDTVWSESYEAAKWDLGTAENKTVVGNFAREGLGLLINMKQLASLGVGFSSTKMVGGKAVVTQTAKQRLASEAVRGGLVDFFINPEEGNLSNMVADSKYTNLLSQALAHKDEDNQFIRRLKNTIEGGTIGIAVDGISELYGALRAGKAARAAGQTAEEAADAAIKKISEELPTKTGKVDLETPEARKTRIEEEFQEAADEVGYDRANPANNTDAQIRNFEKAVQTKSFTTQIAKEGTFKKTQTLPNGTEVQWYGTPSADYGGSFHNSLGVGRDELIEIGWTNKAEGKLGTSARKLNSFFNNIAKDEIPAGTIIEVQPIVGGKDIDSPAEYKKFLKLREEYLEAGAMNSTDPRFANKGFDDVATENNIRAKLYQRAGFSEVKGGSTQYGIVRATPDAQGRYIQPLKGGGEDGFTFDKAEVKAQIDEAKSKELVGSRKIENDVNSAKVGEEGKFEPHERSMISNENAIEDVAVSQNTEAAHRFLDDSEYKTLNTVEDLSAFIKERSDAIDVDEIARRLNKQPIEYTTGVLRTLAEYASEGSIKTLDNLRFTNTQGIKAVDAGGAVALDVMIKDTGRQLSDLAENLMDVDSIGGDFARQAQMMLDRSKSLIRLKKEATMFSSYNLQNWKEVPLALTKEIQAADAEIVKQFDKFEKAFASGNPEELLAVKKEFKLFASAVNLAGGDPTKIQNFWHSYYKMGFQSLNKAMIQSWLSSPLTHARNIAGNAFVAIERPLAIALGGTNPQKKAAAAMFDSFGETLKDSFRVAKESLKYDDSIVGGTKFAMDYKGIAKQELDNLSRNAATTSERAAVNMLTMFNNIHSHPWASWSGKGLQAGDDFFKTMVSRMDLRYQAAIEADAVEGVLKGDKYKELLDKKIGPKGEILDSELLRSATEATFQKDLEGKMKKIADSINDHPEIKQFIPFIKTPHNINVYAFEHIPFLARGLNEYKQVMKTGTDMEKAIMKGREAIGFGLITMAAISVGTGNMTGNPPRDKELREIWLRDHEPFSIKIGNKWVSYRSIVGAELLFSAIADTVELGKMLPEGETDKLLGQLAYTVMNTATNRSFFKGFIDLTELFNLENISQDQLAKLVGDRINAAVPLAGARTQFENALKSGMYEYRNTLHGITGKLTAGVIGDKIPQIDILTGEQMQTGYEGIANSVNPFRVSTKLASPLVKVLSDLQFELSTTVVETHNGLDLTVEEQQYIRKEMYANGKFPKEMERYIKSPAFKRSYDQWEKNRGTVDNQDRKDSDWYRELSRIVSSYKRGAVKKLEIENESFNERMKVHINSKKGMTPKFSNSHSRVMNSLEELKNFNN